MAVQVLKHPVLTSARAAGRVTRVGQNGAFAVLKQAVRFAARTNDVVVSSVKFLNPFKWAKGTAGKCIPKECRRDVTASRAVPRRARVPSAKGCGGPARQASSTSPRPRKASPPGVDGTGRQCATVADGRKTKPSRRRAPASSRGVLRRVVVKDLTPQEVSAAVFEGVTEKVMFTRAHRDLANPNEATRARAAGILGGLRYELSARALSVCLVRDSSAEVRKECVNGLTALGMKEHLPAVEGALSDGSSGVRLAAVRGVHRLAGPDGAASLIRMFSDVDEDVRRRAAACLGWLGEKHLAVELLPLLRGESTSVRLAALEALGNLKSPAVVGEVIERLDDPEEPVQRKAYQVLETITGKQMGETFPEDEKGRRFLIARWRAWQEKTPLRQ